MTIATNLGYPRIGPRRDLKTALEAFWAGTQTEADLRAAAASLRAAARRGQQGAGIGHVPSADFAFYDHVLETAAAFGAIPEGHGWDGASAPSLATIFSMARGGPDVPAMEMTKWFDTNYHYIVPRLAAGQRFKLVWNRWAEAVAEAYAANIRTRPVLLGPVSFLLLSKTDDGSDPLALLPALLPVYAEVLRGIAQAGAAWVQLDEPCLATDLSAKAQAAYPVAMRALADAASGLKLLLTSYFGPMRENLELAASLPVDGFHLDLVRGAADLEPAL